MSSRESTPSRSFTSLDNQEEWEDEVGEDEEVQVRAPTPSRASGAPKRRRMSHSDPSSDALGTPRGKRIPSSGSPQSSPPTRVTRLPRIPSDLNPTSVPSRRSGGAGLASSPHGSIRTEDQRSSHPISSPGALRTTQEDEVVREGAPLSPILPLRSEEQERPSVDHSAPRHSATEDPLVMSSPEQDISSR